MGLAMSKKARQEPAADLKRVLLASLRAAGKTVKASILRIKKIDYKGDVNLVTEVDKRAEKIILGIIKKKYPQHAILAEESAPHGQSPYKWIIDPIDGTTNYAHTLPSSCVSIGLEYRGKMLLGGVYDPFRDELFFAQKGRGAFLNGKKIRVSKIKKIKQSLLATGFPYDRKKSADFLLKVYKEFLIGSQDVRRIGSAALDTCYVACGRFDGYWEQILMPWDIAAASLILGEAGGRLSDFTGNAHSIYQTQALATNGLIHREMLAILKKHYRNCRA